MTRPRNLVNRASDFVSVRDFGAVGDGVTDDTVAIQAALNTGKNVIAGIGTFKITDSLYMDSDYQRFEFTVLRMDAGLGKPAIYIGASSSTGTPSAAVRMFVTVKGRLQGSGTKSPGSAGIAMVQCTTCDIQVWCWYFYAGITVLGRAIANKFDNCDLRYNIYGVYDPSTVPATSDIQGSQFFGGRIEANQKEGIVIGSPNVKFIGTVIEGNGQVANGGNGTDPEVRVIAGTTSGSLHFVDCYMEVAAANTGTAMVLVDAAASRFLHFVGGEFYGNGAATRYVVVSNSASTTQAFTFSGGSYYTVLNYVSATISNNCAVLVNGTYDDVTRTARTSVTATSGAIVSQATRSEFRNNAINTFDQIRSNNDTIGVYQFATRERMSRVAGTAVTSLQVIPSTDITSSVIHVFEIVGVGRASATSGASFKAFVTVAGNAAAPGSVLDIDLISEYNAATVSFTMNGSNGIDATGLSASYAYDFYVRRLIRA